MKELNLDNFYEEFCNKLETDDLQKMYTESRVGFTTYIFGCIGDFLSKTFEYKWVYENWKNGNGTFIQSEYYRIDMIGWTQRREEMVSYLFDKGINAPNKIKSLNSHLWDLDVAIEHENDCTDWLDEAVKLYYVNCPLRIVIGYVDRKGNSINEDLKYLKVAVDALNMLDQDGSKQLVKKADEFGIVLGARDLNEIKGNYQLYKIVRDESCDKNLYKLADNKGEFLN